MPAIARRPTLAFAFVFSILALSPAAQAASASTAASIHPTALDAVGWRLVGPFRAGWGTAVAGIPEQPDTFYFGAAGGGVWKTIDAGRTWHPIFEHGRRPRSARSRSRRSNPKVLYVGTGQVDSALRHRLRRRRVSSGDGGKTLARRRPRPTTRHIGAILVDPRDPDIVLVARARPRVRTQSRARRLPHRATAARPGSKTLFVERRHRRRRPRRRSRQNPRPSSPSLWQVRTTAWLSLFHARSYGPGSGLYKSTDGGETWKRLAGNGWPPASSAASASPSPHRRAWARASTPRSTPEKPTAACIARTTAARTGSASTTTASCVSDGTSRGCTVDPNDPDTVYAMGQLDPALDRRRQDVRRSFKGAPGGDDYHYLWINPDASGAHDHRRATRARWSRVNGGASWSSWYNQPTGQFYHLATDNRFPYWIYTGQQDSGTVAHRQPQRLRRDHLPRLASGRRRRARLRHARSARSGHRLRPRPRRHACRAGTRAPARCRTSRRGRSSSYGARPTTASTATPGSRRSRCRRSAASALPGRAGAVPLARPGRDWSGSAPTSPGAMPAREGLRRRRPCAGRARACGYGVIFTHRPVAARQRRDLGRHRRRPGPAHPRWRQALAERHAAGRAAVRQDRHASTPRRWTRAPPTPRSTTTGDDFRPHGLAHARLRQDAGRRSRAACPTASFVGAVRADTGKARPALRRHRSRACSCRSTTATTGSRCSATCPARRHATCSCTATI